MVGTGRTSTDENLWWDTERRNKIHSMYLLQIDLQASITSGRRSAPWKNVVPVFQLRQEPGLGVLTRQVLHTTIGIPFGLTTYPCSAQRASSMT